MCLRAFEHACVCTCVRLHVHACACAIVCVCLRIYKCVRLRANSAFSRSCVRMRAFTSVKSARAESVHACARWCVCERVRVYVFFAGALQCSVVDN